MIELNQCANPWLGLAPYSVSQSDLFFGRDRDISDICVNIEENTSTVIYGVSGSGKTSIINAGLIPRLSARCDQMQQIGSAQSRSTFGSQSVLTYYWLG